MEISLTAGNFFAILTLFKERIRISGVVRKDDTKDRLIRLVNGMAGVSKIEDNVAVVSLFVD